MRTYNQIFQGAKIEVTCEGSRSTASRTEAGQSSPSWLYPLSVREGSGTNNAYEPVFDLPNGTVSLHVCGLGGTGHEPWEEAWVTLSLVDGAVLSSATDGG